ncbi:hypothetical protein DFH09DRAFT_1117378 [Mycena vulgaris]|nr:hypothetical protein DFH09DRAFT_1117378 [Mycena vulgaris]
MDSALAANGFSGAQSVHDYVAVPPVLISRLEQYCAFRRDAVDFAGTPDDLLRYVITSLRGFAHVLRLCIPADALSFEDLPAGRFRQLIPFVTEYVAQAAVVYDIARLCLPENAGRYIVDLRAMHCLQYALDFDLVMGSPTDGYGPSSRAHQIGRVTSALRLANDCPSSEYDLDVAIPLDVICLPCMPPWTASEIETLANVAEWNFWGMEKYLLQTEHDTSDRLIEKLDRAHLYAYQRFGLGTSGRTTV